MKDNPVWEFNGNYIRIKVNGIIVILIDTDSDLIHILDNYVPTIDMLKHIVMHYDEAENIGKLE